MSTMSMSTGTSTDYLSEFFDNVNHDWLMRFLEHDIADRPYLRYVRRFLKAGIMEDAYFPGNRMSWISAFETSSSKSHSTPAALAALSVADTVSRELFTPSAIARILSPRL